MKKYCCWIIALVMLGSTGQAMAQLAPDHPSIEQHTLMFQKGSALAQWFRARTENTRGTRKTMIVALARTANCPVAPGDHWRGPGWRRVLR